MFAEGQTDESTRRSKAVRTVKVLEPRRRSSGEDES